MIKSQPPNEFVLSFQESFTISEEALLMVTQLKIQNSRHYQSQQLLTREAESFKVPNASYVLSYS